MGHSPIVFLLRLSKKSVIVKIDSQFNGFLLSGFPLQKWGIPNFIARRSACCARILTYCATHALPYRCTPTSVSCLSSELFRSLSACRKEFFDTLGGAFPFGNAPLFYSRLCLRKTDKRFQYKHNSLCIAIKMCFCA